MLGIERTGSVYPNSALLAASEPPACFCRRIRQVPVLQRGSLPRHQGWTHTKPHSCCICLTLCGANPSQGSDLWLGSEPAKRRIQDLAWIYLCIYIMTEKANSLQANMSQNKNSVKVSWAQQWDDVIPATHWTLELPDRPERFSAKSNEKVPAGKPPTDTPAGFSKQLEPQCLTLSSRHSCRA